MNSVYPYLLVGAGGFFGAIARYGIARLSAHLFGVSFPFGTFIINITGSFLLGLIATWIGVRLIPYSEEIRLAICIGFLGAYTTFSTFEFESHVLFENGNWPLGLTNFFASLLVGLLAVRLGIILGSVRT